MRDTDADILHLVCMRLRDIAQHLDDPNTPTDQYTRVAVADAVDAIAEMELYQTTAPEDRQNCWLSGRLGKERSCDDHPQK